MRIAMEAAKFTPDGADALRRAMATFRRHGTLGLLNERIVGRMVARGYDPKLANRCFRRIVSDAREHGVEVRPVDVNASGWDNGMEVIADGGHALRLGMRQVGGLRKEDAARIVSARREPHPDIGEFRHPAGIPVSAIETLAAADAFRFMGLDRGQGLWQVHALAKASPLPLFEAAGRRDGGRSRRLPFRPWRMASR